MQNADTVPGYSDRNPKCTAGRPMDVPLSFDRIGRLFPVGAGGVFSERRDLVGVDPLIEPITRRLSRSPLVDGRRTAGFDEALQAV